LNQDQGDFENTEIKKCTSLRVVLYVLGALYFIILTLVCQQPCFEAMTKPGAQPFERYVTVEGFDGFKVNLRTVCMGPGFNDTKLEKTSPSFLLEVGGGASAIDLAYIQRKIAVKYTVCSYDRAGYGKSW
jgi:hypothetical protein